MANEALVYKALEKNQAAADMIPRFRGHSQHLGVAMKCIEKELGDFDVIGIENLTEALKRSAIRAVEILNEAGALHNDIELRNIVQSKTDPECAKIIDFGRALFTTTEKSLRNRSSKSRFS